MRDWLIEHEVPVDRIFLRPTQLGAGETKPGAEQDTKAKAARADFSLK